MNQTPGPRKSNNIRAVENVELAKEIQVAKEAVTGEPSARDLWSPRNHPRTGT